MRLLLVSLTLLLVCVIPLNAREIPSSNGYVTDQADIISQTVELKLEQFLREFENSDSTQITVLTIPSLEGEALEDFSLRVFENWQIGQLAKDNGALLLVARDERAIRIEVGYGLEGRLTDLLAGRIIDNEISPKFQQGDFDAGIIAGVLAMTETVKGEYAGSGRSATNKKRSSPYGLFFLLFFLGPLLGRLLGRRGSRRHRRSGLYVGGPFMGGGFGGGGFGGGGFSGGGGGAGGGGASGGW